MFLKIVCTSILVAITSLSATNWPQLDKNDQQECLQILHMAESVFHSLETRVYKIPKNMLGIGIELLIEAKEDNSSDNGKSIKVSDKVFETVTAPCLLPGKCYPSELNVIYWQRDGIEGFRFVLYERKMGWRGSMYTLFSIEENLSQSDFIAQREVSSLKPLFPESWQPPIMLQHVPSQKIWAIEVGNSYDILSDWNVYLAKSPAISPRCVVHFRPSIKRSWDLLPKPVQRLAYLLDGTLGNGEKEGTLQQTARLRCSINQDWANVVLRPWAINNAYNSRIEVDLGLSNWSHKNKKFTALYQKIIQQYPRAEEALAEHYENQFQLTKEKAEHLAKYVLDSAFRGHFIFPSLASADNQSTTIINPWND